MDSEVSSGPAMNGGGLWTSRAISAMIFRLGELRTAMLDVESAFEVALRQIPPERLASARNLLHYVALRRHDIRPLQEELLQRGLSSLGRCESHVLANVDAVLEVLQRIRGRRGDTSGSRNQAADFRSGQLLIEKAAQERKSSGCARRLTCP